MDDQHGEHVGRVSADVTRDLQSAFGNESDSCDCEGDGSEVGSLVTDNFESGRIRNNSLDSMERRRQGWSSNSGTFEPTSHYAVVDIEQSVASPSILYDDNTSPERRHTLPVSLNADIPDTQFSKPVRARSRIWSALGLVGQVRNPNDNGSVSRSPHQCQSHDSILQQASIEHGSPQGHLVSHQSLTHRMLPASASNLVTAEVPSIQDISDISPTFSNVSLSTQAGVTSSGDSHCHTNQKKNSMDKKARTKLILASVLCLLFMSGEMVGGLLAHSLAIISDAAHLLTDFASFMISLVALYLANRPATKKLSFGWYRAEILGAFTSILMLWVLTGILVYSAVNRVIDDDYTIDATVMLITAATGVAFNILLGTTLHQHTHSHGGGGHGHSHGGQGHSHGGHGHGHSQGHRRPSAPLASSNATPSYGSVDNMERGNNIGVVVDSNTPLLGADASDESSESHGHSHNSNINVKAAFIHVIGDLFQSVGVLVAAFIIYFKPEWKIADPICTFMFSLFVLVTTVTIMRDIVVVLMEGTPRGINFAEVRDTFFEIPGVLDIHNLRVWSLTMDKVALSVHLAIDKRSDPHRVLKLASRAIQRKFNISETTMQVEEYVTDMVDCSDCKGP